MNGEADGPGPQERVGKHRGLPHPEEVAAQLQPSPEEAAVAAAELRLTELDRANRAGRVLPSDQIGRYQAELGQEWAAEYMDRGREVPPWNAEIVLRNPRFYSEDSRVLASLPGALQQRWQNLDAYARGLAERGATTPKEWSEHTNGLAQVQVLVEAGQMSPTQRGGVADVMIESSRLLAESLNHNPGNLQYMQGNVLGAAADLKHLKKA